MARQGGVGGPLLYGVLLGYLAAVAGAVYNLAFGAAAARWLPSQSDMPPYLEEIVQNAGSVFGLIMTLLFGWVGVIIFLFVAAGLFHLVLMLLGGAQGDFEVSFRVVCYAQATELFKLLPLCGWPISMVYSLVLTIIGLSEGHGISRGKAAAAVLLPLLLCCCCLPLGFAALSTLLAGLVGGMGH